MSKEQFWIKRADGGRHFDFDALRRSLSDEPMTEAEKQMLEEIRYKSADEISNHFEDDRLTTKEGYDKLSSRFSSAYHREEYYAGLD